MSTHTCYWCHKEQAASEFLNRGKYWSACSSCIAEWIADAAEGKPIGRRKPEPPACPDCADTGYIMQDVGTSMIPDIVEVNCRCNPVPTDAEIPDRVYWTNVFSCYDEPGSDEPLNFTDADNPDNEPDADWETNNRFNDARYVGF